MLWKYLVLQLQAKRSKGVTNHHKKDDASYVHAKEIEKWNKNFLNSHMCKQHSKELLYCYDCLEEKIEDWTFCWETVYSKILYLLANFGLSRHSHSYIDLLKAVILIGLFILFICPWFSVTKISWSSFLLTFSAF